MRRMFKLSRRLESCAKMVTGGAKIVDVGSDHAYLPIWLVANGIVPSGIAVDINEGPLGRARENVGKYNVRDKISVLKSDGLNGVEPGSVDEIIIAGMGGELISKIISEANWVKDLRKNLILQPMKSEKDLREYLHKENFFIKKEVACICKRKVYTTMLVTYCGEIENVPVEYPYVGKLPYNMNECAVKYMKSQIKDINNRLKGNPNSEQDLLIINNIKHIINNYFKGC